MCRPSISYGIREQNWIYLFHVLFILYFSLHWHWWYIDTIYDLWYLFIYNLNIIINSIMFQFCCVLFFCVGGLVTTMNMTVDIQTKVEMSRDIFLCVIVAWVLSLVLGAISKIKRAQSSQKYTVMNWFYSKILFGNI